MAINMKHIQQYELLIFVLLATLSLSTSIYSTEQDILSSPPECRRDEFMMKVNDTKICQPCSQCNPGEGARRQCLPTKDTICIHCKPGKRFSMEINGQRKCIKCSRCHGNKKVKQQCTPTSDTVCGACKKGFYWDAIVLDCKPCSLCDQKLLSLGLIWRLPECANNQPEMQCVSSDYDYYPIMESESAEARFSKQEEDPAPNHSTESKQTLVESSVLSDPEQVHVERAALNDSKKTKAETTTSSRSANKGHGEGHGEGHRLCSGQRSYGLFYASVFCLVVSIAVLVLTLFVCCVSVRRINKIKRKGKSPIYRPVSLTHKRVPAEGSLTSLGTFS